MRDDLDSTPALGRPLRVGFLAQENLPVPPASSGGSVSRVVYELARGLGAGGEHEVTVCSLPHPSIPEGIHESVRYLRVPAALDRRRHARYRQVVRVLRRLDLPHRELQGFAGYGRAYATQGILRLGELDPDVVHLQNVSQFAPLARRLLPRARIVLHMHCDWLRDLPAPAARARLADVDLVLGVSDYIGGRISEGFPEVAHRVRTLHNGVDTDLYAPGAHDRAALRRSRQLGEGPVILYVGAIAPEKGTHVLLQAFAQVGRALPDARLVLVGSPNRYFQVRSRRGRRARAEARLEQRNYAGEAERLASLCGGRVLLAGQRPPEELREWYALADVLVMPSTGEEPFPLPVLEALASALPVVATVRGGLPEIVLDGRTGRLVAAGDVEGLAEALVHLGRDPDLRAELGRRGRELVCERFSWTHQAEVLAGYYRELVAAAEPVSQVGA